MTKTQIQERQNAIMNQMDEMETRSREANGGEIKFIEEEATKSRKFEATDACRHHQYVCGDGGKHHAL